MSVPSIRFARTQARGLADHLMACARDASVTLGYRLNAAPAVPLPPTPITKRRRSE
jgi:hypothetical protein